MSSINTYSARGLSGSKSLPSLRGANENGNYAVMLNSNGDKQHEDDDANSIDLKVPTDIVVKPELLTSTSTHVPGSATWVGAKVTARDFRSEHTLNYTDPNSRDTKDVVFELKPPPGQDTARRANRDKAVQKFIELAKNRYGSVGKMLVRFKLHPGHWVDFDEFSNNLRKRNIDKNFKEEEQRLFFEKFCDLKDVRDRNVSNNLIAVDDILDYVSEKNSRGGLNSSEIQYELFERLSKLKKEARLAGSKEIIGAQVRSNLKKMFGDDCHNIVPEEDVQAFVDDLFSTDGPATGTGGSSILLGASRFVNGGDDIFTEVNDLHSMKGTRRRGDWGYSPKLVENLRRKGKLDIKSLKAPLSDKQACADEAFSDIVEYLTLSRVDLSLVPFLENRTSKLAATKRQIDHKEKEINTPHLLGRMMELFDLEHIKPAVKDAKERNKLANLKSTKDLSGINVDRKDNIFLDDIDESPSLQTLPPLKNSPRKYAFRDFNQSDDKDFKAFDAGFGTMKDPALVTSNKLGKSNDTANKLRGKKLYNSNEITDWTRVGYGGPKESYQNLNTFANTSMQSLYHDTDGMYTTSNARTYPELIYEPSKPVIRNVESDADLAYQERRRVRKARYARKSKNLNMTLTRIEFENLEAECREKRRVQRRAQDMVRYDSVNLMGGLVGFKKQPSQMVGRKQNLEMFKKMFVGQVTMGNIAKSAPENRDFSTTYTSEYTSDCK